jgi:TonB family protein
MLNSRFFSVLVAIAWLSSWASARVAISFAAASASPRPSVAREIQTSTGREAEFAAMPRTSLHAYCEANEPPQALATPEPLLDLFDRSSKVSVSFIIGADGRVQSPLILDSAGPQGDRTVLEVVRSWRYRPATCDGVPTESEAKVEFLGR